MAEFDSIKRKQVLVKLDDYKDIRLLMNTMKDKLSEARSILSKINELKKQEQVELDVWQKSIDDIEHKIGSIDGILFERGR